MLNRRDALQLAVAAALAPEVACARHGRGAAGASGMTFNYYISTSGSDSNPGTLAEPWAITSLTTSSVNYSSLSGKTIGLLSGTYDVSTLTPSSVGCKLSIPSGTSTASTVVQSVTPRAAIILDDPSESGYQWGGYIVGSNDSNPQYITVDGLTVNGTVNAPQNMVGGTYASRTGVGFEGNTTACVGLVVQNCEIYNLVTEGTNQSINTGCVAFGEYVSGALVHNCKLHDTYLTGVARNEHSNSSGVHDDAIDTTVEYCTIYGCTNGVYSKIGTPPPQGMTVRYCYFYAGAGMNNAFCGFDSSNGSAPPYASWNFYNNVFEGLALLNYFGTIVEGFQASANFYNNTVYQMGFQSLETWTPTSAAYSAGCEISLYNNILAGANAVTDDNGALSLGPAAGEWQVCDYNLWPSNVSSAAVFGLTSAFDVDPVSLMTLASWQALSGAPDTHSLTGAPTFETSSPVAGGGATQYVLTSGSLGHGAGRVGGVSTGASLDMGAWGGTDVNTGEPIAQIGSSF